MKKLLILVLALAPTLLTANLAHAGAKFPLEGKGTVCVGKSESSLDEVLAMASAKANADMNKNCGMGGSFAVFKGSHITALNHGCPFGHEFEYTLSGTCVIP
jgi:hypothetical protein